MHPKKHRAVQRRLLCWYDRNRRDLPWRRTRDPYAIWVAETMLQQTQVSVVIPYYKRFLKAFPTLRSLAHAPLPRLLAHWSGLGYYRRVEHMKKSAALVVRDYNARLPDDYNALLSLPGIGAYTAGALMSIAFDKPHPALDGNAGRVISRVFKRNGATGLSELASRLVPASRPGCFNQALMELGATVCIPLRPRCTACPIAGDCDARTGGGTGRTSVTKKVFKRVVWPVAIVRSRGRILLRRRDSGRLLSGMWELPGGEINGHETIRGALRKHIGIAKGSLTRAYAIGHVHHHITRRKIVAPVYLFEGHPFPGSRRAASDWRWVAPASLHLLPVSTMTRKALKILQAHEKDFS